MFTERQLMDDVAIKAGEFVQRHEIISVIEAFDIGSEQLFCRWHSWVDRGDYCLMIANANKMYFFFREDSVDFVNQHEVEDYDIALAHALTYNYDDARVYGSMAISWLMED